MAFERRFNAIRFYSKLNHFVLSPRKKPNHFVLKIRPGGFADYTQEEAVGRFDLKRLPDHASETVRVVHVGDYDECLCIGLHVENTSQIGIFKIISYDYKEGIFRMRFKLTEAQ